MADARLNATDTIPDQCGCCGKPATKRCGACGKVKYCDNKTCQKGDWKYHKTICKIELASNTRPSPNHFRAMLLPEDRAGPEYVWLPEDSEDAYAGVRELLGEGRLGWPNRMLIVHKDSPNGKFLDHSISVYYRSEFALDDVSQVNACLKGMVGEEYYKGPLVLIGEREEPVKVKVSKTSYNVDSAGEDEDEEEAGSG